MKKEDTGQVRVWKGCSTSNDDKIHGVGAGMVRKTGGNITEGKRSRASDST